MPGRPIAAFVLALAAGSAVAADDAPAHYTLRYDAAAETMAVRLCLPYADDSVRFTADRAAAGFIEGLARTSGPAPVREHGVWAANGWHAGECLSYRAALGRIVDAGDRGLGARHGGAIVVDPDVWLLRTDDADRRAPAEVDVKLPAGYAISAPWHPAAAGNGATRFSMPPTPKDWLARVAIGRFGSKDIALRGGTLRLSILDGADAPQRAMLEAWLSHVSRATLSAYGKLPLDDVQVLICPECQRSHDWQADLDRCARCASVRLVRVLGATQCKDCGHQVAASARVTGQADDRLRTDVAAALARRFGASAPD